MTAPAEIKVWDPLVRVFHWSLVVAFTLAFLTEDDWQWLHVIAGYTVLGLVLVRLVWGLVGPRHARFSDFVHRPRTVWQYTQAVLRGRAERYIGHNPAGGAMIVALLVMLLVTTGLGLCAYGARGNGPLGDWLGELSAFATDALTEAHELAAWLTVWLIAGHLLGVLWESLLHRENLVRAMITGRKRAAKLPGGLPADPQAP